MALPLFVDSCLTHREVRWERECVCTEKEEGTKEQTAVSEANVGEKIRRHRNPFRNHSRFLEEDIKKEKPQPKVQRELKEKRPKPEPDSLTTSPCSPWAGEAK